ncbi:MAG: glycosyltransferase, partial [Victivallales bacterium]|nr:glycosyltransferase [Victivallales bacterium]
MILCGGTGGHFFPGLSIASEIRGNGSDVKLLLSGKNAGKQASIAAEHSIESAILANLPAPVGFGGKARFSAAFLGAWLSARKLLKSENPDSILAMGSFTSVPAALAAVSLGVPLHLHDGNAKIGKANRFLSRFARTLLLSYPIVNASSIHCHTALTGMPTRPELNPEQWNKKTKSDAVNEFNARFAADFSADTPTLLIFGGSQGAATFNKKLPEVLRSLNIEKAQIIHLSGTGQSEETRKRYADSPFKRIVM